MTIAYLLLLIPLIFGLQAGYKFVQWVRSGTAGVEGFTYTRSEDPSWYYLNLFCCLILIGFYVISGIFLFMSLKSGGFKLNSAWSFVYMFLIVSQGVGLTKKKNSSPA
jgi:hypothetical protein